MKKLSDVILDALAAAGAKHVFLVPGGAAMHLNDSLARHAVLTHSCMFHEQAATVAAEAYAKLRNGLGVAMVTAGPGSTNAVTGVASAWVNSAPLVVISGQVKSADLNPGFLRQNGLQEVDIVSMVRPITKYAATVTDPAEFHGHVQAAIRLAMSGRRGPVWLCVPLDVQAALVEELGWPSQDVPRVHEPVNARADIDTVIERLNNSKRPVLLAGYGIRAANAVEQFQEMVRVLKIPVQTTWIGSDLIDERHPLFAGRPGSFASRPANFTIQNSDFVIAIGARLDFATTAYRRDLFAREAYKVVVDVDRNEIDKLKGCINLGIVMDAGQFIDAMLSQAASIDCKPRAEWQQQLKSWTQAYPITPQATSTGAGFRQGQVSTYQLVKALARNLGADDVIVEGSSGIHSEIFFMTFEFLNGQRVIADGSFGSMGYGLPAAIGACVAADNRRTILIEGDGSLQPQLQELEAIRRDALPVKIFVVNNDGYSSIRVSQNRYFGRLICADSTSGLTLPDLSKIAAAYGIRYLRICDEATLDESLHAALSGQDPVICEVIVPPDEDRTPRVSSTQLPDGRMISRPMEDMYPFLDREEFQRNMIIPAIPEN